MKYSWIIIRRIISTVPTLIGVIIVTFLLARALPGDPAAYYAGAAATAESIAEIRERLGLDRALIVQFFDYVGQLAQGDLGISLSSGQPVLDDLFRRLPASIELTLAALLFAVAVGLPLGVLAAVRPGSIWDHSCRIFVTVGAAFPTFFVALVLVFGFYYKLDIAPPPLGRLDDIILSPPAGISGLYLVDSLLAGDLVVFRAALAQLTLPAISLGLFALAPIARITRASMLSALGSGYCRTARAMGLSSTRTVFGYALRNASLQIINVLGMVFSFLLGANVLVEQVFAWPGIGAYAVNAVISSDYAAVQGFVLMMAILFVLLNLFVDLTVSVLDPRIRFDV